MPAPTPSQRIAFETKRAANAAANAKRHANAAERAEQSNDANAAERAAERAYDFASIAHTAARWATYQLANFQTDNPAEIESHADQIISAWNAAMRAKTSFVTAAAAAARTRSL